MKEAIHSLAELEAHAQKFLETILLSLPADKTGATIVALIGNLGSGKTAWTKMLAKHLGVTEVVNSPTFVIQKNYPTAHLRFSTITHIDAYRLGNKEDLAKLGWEALIADPKRIICIEWPSQVEGLVPENAHKIFFNFVNEGTREIAVYYAHE